MRNESKTAAFVEVVVTDLTAGSFALKELRTLLDSVAGIVVSDGDSCRERCMKSAAACIRLIVTPHTNRSEIDHLFEAQYPQDRLILAALHYDQNTLAAWLKAGVVDFFGFPWNRAEIVARILGVCASLQPDPHFGQNDKLGLGQLLGDSAAFRCAVERIPAIAACDAGVLITGETGTGKELCARAIHSLGQRSSRPFVPVNCGAIPAELVENELFGHGSGAYTSAGSQQAGLISEAEGGSLLLDEVDSLPLSAQVKLLRFLQSREYRPLGTTRTLHANVRVIAATNANPLAAVRDGKLRQDLYYRLNVVPLQLPPLRDRQDDIPLLAKHFLRRYSVEYAKPVHTIAAPALHKLRMYDWPGNIRELENMIARAVVLSTRGTLTGDDLELPDTEPSNGEASLRGAKDRFERVFIEDKLRSCGGNISQAARSAGKNRRSFFELIRKHGIEVDRFRSLTA